MSIDAVTINIDDVNRQVVYLQSELTEDKPVYFGEDVCGEVDSRGFTEIGNATFINIKSFQARWESRGYEKDDIFSAEQQVVNAYLLHGIFERKIMDDWQLNLNLGFNRYSCSDFLQQKLEITMKETGIVLDDYRKKNFDVAIDDISRSTLYSELYPGQKYDWGKRSYY